MKSTPENSTIQSFQEIQFIANAEMQKHLQEIDECLANTVWREDGETYVQTHNLLNRSLNLDFLAKRIRKNGWIVAHDKLFGKTFKIRIYNPRCMSKIEVAIRRLIGQ